MLACTRTAVFRLLQVQRRARPSRQECRRQWGSALGQRPLLRSPSPTGRDKRYGAHHPDPANHRLLREPGEQISSPFCWRRRLWRFGKVSSGRMRHPQSLTLYQDAFCLRTCHPEEGSAYEYEQVDTAPHPHELYMSILRRRNMTQNRVRACYARVRLGDVGI